MRVIGVLAALCLAVCVTEARPGCYSYYQPVYQSYAPVIQYYYYGAMRWQGSNYPAGLYGKYNGVWYHKPAGAYYGYPLGQVYSTPSTPPENWQSLLLQVQKKRDEYIAYEKSLSALGLTPGYGGQYQYRAPQAAHYAPNLGNGYAQGQTIYGTSYQQVQQAYGSLDMNTLYQQAARLTAGAQSLATQANTEFSGNLSIAADGQARVAEALAKGQAAAAALRAASPDPSTTTKTTVTQFGTQAQQTNGATPPPAVAGSQSSNVPPAAPSVGAPAGGATFEQLIVARCASCHGAEKQEGKLDLRNWPRFTEEQKNVVLSRLLSKDPKKRMPLAEGGEPGTPLAPEEIRLFKVN